MERVLDGGFLDGSEADRVAWDVSQKSNHNAALCHSTAALEMGVIGILTFPQAKKLQVEDNPRRKCVPAPVLCFAFRARTEPARAAPFSNNATGLSERRVEVPNCNCKQICLDA